MKNNLIALIVLVLLVPLNASAQWSTFHFVDEWGDKTDDVGARSAPTRAVNGLPFPYQDRRLRLFVDNCQSAWIRFNDNMVFGREHIKIRVDGEDVSVHGTSDHRTDITIRNARVLIPLLAKANRVDVLVPLHDMNPKRFMVNMSGSMKAMEAVCSVEELAEREVAVKRAQAATARSDSIRKARHIRYQVRRDSIIQARAESQKVTARQKVTAFCEKFIQQEIPSGASLQELIDRVNMRPHDDEGMLLVNGSEFRILPRQEAEAFVNQAMFHYVCDLKTLTPKLNRGELKYTWVAREAFYNWQRKTVTLLRN